VPAKYRDPEGTDAHLTPNGPRKFSSPIPLNQHRLQHNPARIQFHQNEKREVVVNEVLPPGSRTPDNTTSSSIEV
jgi:hypothetical protein